MLQFAKVYDEELREWLKTHLFGSGLPDHDIHFAGIYDTVVWDQCTGEVYTWNGRRTEFGMW